MTKRLTDLRNRIIMEMIEHPFLVLFLLASFVNIIVCVFRLAPMRFHSDAASFILFTQEAIHGKSLVPPDWYYATATGIWIGNIFMILFTPFIQDQLTLGLAAKLGSIAFTVFSLWLLDKYVIKSKSFMAVAGLFLLLPFPGIERYVFLTDGNYESTLLLQALIISLFCFACNDDFNFVESFKESPKKAVIFSAVFVLLNLCSILSIPYSVFPLIAGVILLYCKNNWDSKKLDNKSLRGIVGTVVILCGLALIAIFLNHITFMNANFRGMNQTFLNGEQIFERLNHIPNWIPEELFGVTTKTALFSVAGMMNLVKIVLGIALYFVFPVLLTVTFNRQSAKMQLFIVYCWIIIVTNLLFFLFTNITDRFRSLAATTIILLVMSGVFINDFMLRRTRILKFAAMIGLSLIVVAYMFPHLETAKKYDETLESKREITNYLKSEGLTYGYATFWNANNNTILSNQAVEIRGVKLAGLGVTPYLWLTSGRWYETLYHTGTTFVMFSDNEVKNNDANSLSVYGSPVKVLKHSEYNIYVYDYNIAENNFNGRLINLDLRKSIRIRDDNGSGGFSESDSVLLIPSGARIYGPYMPLAAGDYVLDVDIETDKPITLALYYNKSKSPIKDVKLSAGQHQVEFTLTEDIPDFEASIRNKTGAEIKINALAITKGKLANESEIKDNAPAIEKSSPDNSDLRKSMRIRDDNGSGGFSESDNVFLIPSGALMYGPYMPLADGDYVFDIDIETDKPITLALYYNKGKSPIKEVELTAGLHQVEFTLAEDIPDFEASIRNKTGAEIKINALAVTKK